jgi:hypothetical protein
MTGEDSVLEEESGMGDSDPSMDRPMGNAPETTSEDDWEAPMAAEPSTPAPEGGEPSHAEGASPPEDAAMTGDPRIEVESPGDEPILPWTGVRVGATSRGASRGSLWPAHHT